MNIYLFISLLLLFTFLLGKRIEKYHIPWIFASLFFGIILAIHNPFSNITNSEIFNFLSDLGMYFLLFMVGFEVNLKEMKKQGKFIVISSLTITLFSAFIGAIFIRYVFSLSWLISILVALSFATVGEAVLIPILDKLKIINSKLGQAIIGIGSFDDIIEVSTLIFVSVMIGVKLQHNIIFMILSLVLLVLMSLILKKMHKYSERFRFANVETLFLLAIFILFLFIGFGINAEAAPLAALLAGVSLRTFVPEERCRLIEKEIKAVVYGLFAPIFFLWIGASIDFSSLTTGIYLILLVVVISALGKIIPSVFFTGKHFDFKESLLLGIALSVRFSTGIIVMKIFLDANLIDKQLYSIIIASSIIFTVLIPIVFSNLLYYWRKKINL